MRTLVIAFALISSVQTALACMPPKDRLVVQAPELNLIVNSADLYAKIREYGGEAIHSIQYARGVYQVISSNNCMFEVKPRWEARPFPGACPQLNGLNISDAICR